MLAVVTLSARPAWALTQQAADGLPLINSLPADIICDSFDLVVVQWNRETQTLRSACGTQKAFSLATAGRSDVKGSKLQYALGVPSVSLSTEP